MLIKLGCLALTIWHFQGGEDSRLFVRFASQPLAVENTGRKGAVISDKLRAKTSDSKTQEYFLFKALELFVSSSI